MSTHPSARPAISLVTLGCPKNLVDSEVMLGDLHRSGLKVAERPEDADVVIINTCAFVTEAQEESIETILTLARLKQTARLRGLIVTGCLAQRHGLSLLEELPEVDYLLGPGASRHVVEVVSGLLAGELSRGARLDGLDRIEVDWEARVLSGSRHAAYVKISEGCSRACSFCIIPRLRGPHRSRKPETIEAEARHLARSGVKEITLVAQDTTAYGIDLTGQPMLDQLLDRCQDIPDLRWIRVLYTYPGRWNDRLIDAFTRNSKVVPYVDLPIQHASDAVLTRMRRGFSWASTEALLLRLRRQVPGIALRTTILTGFPGEREEDFEFLLRALRDFEFDHLGAFSYSREEGTEAAGFSELVSDQVCAERRDRVLAQQRVIALRRNRARIGEELEVLIESVESEKGIARGRWAGQAPEIDGQVLIPLETTEDKTAKQIRPQPVPGDFLRVRVRGAGPYDLIGSLSREG